MTEIELGEVEYNIARKYYREAIEYLRVAVGFIDEGEKGMAISCITKALMLLEDNMNRDDYILEAIR